MYLKKDENFNIYKYLPFVILVLLISKFILTDGALKWFFSAFNTTVLAVVIIYLLEPIVDWLELRTRFSRKMCVLLSYFIFFSVIIITILLLAPSIKNSIVFFIRDLPDDYKTFLSKLDDFNFYGFTFSESNIKNFINIIIKQLTESFSQIINYSTDLLNSVAKILKSIAMFFIAIIMAYYSLIESDRLSKRVKYVITRIFNKKVTRNIIEIGHIINVSFKNFLIGKLTTCFLLGLFIYICILLANTILRLNIPYGPLIGLIIGLTNIIPYVGAIIGTVPCFIFSLFKGVPEAIAVLAIIIGMQQVDNLLISPKILGKTVGVKPFWIIASLTIGGGLFGAMGMILSVPIAAVIQTLWTRYSTK